MNMPLPVTQFDDAEAGDRPMDDEDEVANFDFAVAVDMSAGFPWASAVLTHGKDDVYAIGSFILRNRVQFRSTDGKLIFLCYKLHLICNVYVGLDRNSTICLCTVQ